MDFIVGLIKVFCMNATLQKQLVSPPFLFALYLFKTHYACSFKIHANYMLEPICHYFHCSLIIFCPSFSIIYSITKTHQVREDKF